jgi:hypothetical protein
VSTQLPLPDRDEQRSLGAVNKATRARKTTAKTKGDHKRKAVALAPARVVVSSDGNEIVVVVPDVLGKNAAHWTPPGKGGMRITSTQTKKFRESVRAGAWRWSEFACPGPTFALAANGVDSATCAMPWTKAFAGAWRLEVLGVWPTKRDVIKGRPCDIQDCPMGDADAAVPQAIDALQHAGILDDDARLVDARGFNMYRRGERHTVIRLVRVPDLAERDAAIAHLVAMLPPPTAVAEPTRPRTKAARRKAKETT